MNIDNDIENIINNIFEDDVENRNQIIDAFFEFIKDYSIPPDVEDEILSFFQKCKKHNKITKRIMRESFKKKLCEALSSLDYKKFSERLKDDCIQITKGEGSEPILD
jgi:hypothetical protein